MEHAYANSNVPDLEIIANIETEPGLQKGPWTQVK